MGTILNTNRDDLENLEIDPRIRQCAKLTDPKEFDHRFNELLSEYETNREAYHAVEYEHKFIFGETKYSSYESYRISRKKRI